MRQFVKGYEDRLTGEDKSGYKKSQILIESLTKALLDRLQQLFESTGK